VLADDRGARPDAPAVFVLLACHLFFVQVAVGFLVFTFLVKRESLGHGFYQLHLTIAFVFGVLSLWGMGRPFAAFVAPEKFVDLFASFVVYGTTWYLALTFLAVFLYSFQQKLAKMTHLAAVWFALFFFSFEAWFLARELPAWPGRLGSLMVGINMLGAAAVLALSTIAMNVGHWYLVKPRLGSQHLIGISAFFFFAIIYRGVFLMASLFRGFLSTDWQPAEMYEPWYSDSLTVIFLVLRILVGFVAPAVLAWMALETARIRSTQAATGLLFALMIPLIIGEALAVFLTLTTGIPW
jgi:hypothetical protein